MAESLPPPGQRRRSVRNSRKRSLEVDEAEQPAEKSTDLKNEGIFRTSEKCAMCRMVIPSDYLEMPDLLEVPEPSIPAADGQEAFQWFYEGRHGESSNDMVTVPLN
ncbi:unnamed protein product [Nesidiocoris tenuis]|uniref:Uncharacterized protein n=1 Tax=Nesidiocoris tenuis TaxID=355587 RepID=A0A6H5H1B8_9HEMI|nr:unnamed protein product [Nesidiocoris tenuis]